MSYWNHGGRKSKLIPYCPRCNHKMAVYWRREQDDFFCCQCHKPFKRQLSANLQKENNIEAIECSKIQMMING